MLAVAIPVDTSEASTSVAVVGEPAKPAHSELAHNSAEKEKHKTGSHHGQHRGAHKEHETEGEHKEPNTGGQPASSLVRRQVTLEQAKAHAKNYKTMQKAHLATAETHRQTAMGSHDQATADTHHGIADEHLAAAEKAGHLHQAYTHTADAMKSEHKAAAATRAGTRANHLADAQQSRADAQHHFTQAAQLHANL
ncbi:hypothetical protein FRC17_008134 [Serendipita sp. 399]|nr:hypothetical protein FRC17_008134 [Serendipita sp. 399]